MNEFILPHLGMVVAAVTLASVLVCALFLWVQGRKKVKRSFNTADNSTGHAWDEDLQELNNPMPRWWVFLFYITVVFGLGYLFVFPGLGSYAGRAGWSSHAQYQAERAALEAKTAKVYAEFAPLNAQQLAANPRAMAMSQRLFLNNCAQCHGADARGSKGFPNLTDTDWLYGGDVQTIQTSIAQGRHGVMPPMAAAVGGAQEQRAVAQYVLSLSGQDSDSILAQFGREPFKAVCAGCHGADGKGNPTLGAPNLSDRIWLYGGSEKTILETIRQGRENNMPSHAKLLSAEQIRVLAAYVKSLSGQTASP